jgi:hypothetical protein
MRNNRGVPLAEARRTGFFFDLARFTANSTF